MLKTTFNLVMYIQGLNERKWFLYIQQIIIHLLNSVQFSHSVVSDSLRPHELQHARLPCPSSTAGVYPNSCSLHRPLGLPRWFSGKESACQGGWPASVPGLGRSLEKEMATLPSLLAWKSNGQRNLGGYSPWDHQWVGHDLMKKQGMEGSSNLPKRGRRGGREMGGKQVDRSLSKLQLILRAFFPNPN